ncbi:hypothetical protein GCM10023259_003920 [Thermocatellispora tengchongensis]
MAHGQADGQPHPPGGRTKWVTRKKPTLGNTAWTTMRAWPENAASLYTCRMRRNNEDHEIPAQRIPIVSAARKD